MPPEVGLILLVAELCAKETEYEILEHNTIAVNIETKIWRLFAIAIFYHQMLNITRYLCVVSLIGSKESMNLSHISKAGKE